jgi:hypothetical protein
MRQAHCASESPSTRSVGLDHAVFREPRSRYPNDWRGLVPLQISSELGAIFPIEGTQGRHQRDLRAKHQVPCYAREICRQEITDHHDLLPGRLVPEEGHEGPLVAVVEVPVDGGDEVMVARLFGHEVEI